MLAEPHSSPTQGSSVAALVAAGEDRGELLKGALQSCPGAVGGGTESHSTRPATARPQEQTHGSQSSRGSTEVVPSSLRPSSVPPPQQEHPTAASTAPCPPDSITNRLEAPGPHRSPAPRRGPAASSLVQGRTPQTGTPPSCFPLLPGQLSEHSQSSTSGPGPHSSCKSSTVRNPGELWLQAARVPQEMSTPQSLHLCRAAASPALKSHTPTWDAS